MPRGASDVIEVRELKYSRVQIGTRKIRIQVTKEQIESPDISDSIKTCLNKSALCDNSFSTPKVQTSVLVSRLAYPDMLS
jgi:hypothetical protein